MQQLVCGGSIFIKYGLGRLWKEGVFFLSWFYYPNIFYKRLGRNIININHFRNIVTKIQDKGKAISVQPGQTLRALGG